MSPRFQRRPERRSGPGGPGRSASGTDRSWGAGKPEWRPQPRGAWRGEGRGEGRSEGRPDGRSDSRGEGRPDRRPQRRPEGRLEGRFEGRFERRFDGPPSPRGDRRSGPERPAPRYGDRPPQRRSSDRDGRPERFGLRREPRREAARDGWRRPEADSKPQGESQSLGEEPPSDLIWGRHSAQAALESGRPIHRIWCTGEMRHSPRFLQLLREAKASGVLVEEVTWARLGQLTGGAVHQGIVLQSAAAETLDLPTLIEGCRQIGEAPLLMAIDGLTDPHNLGAIVRSAEALGAHGMVLPQRRSAGLTGSVAKVAAGALEHLPVARVVNLNRALDSLKQEGYRVVGLAAEGNLTLEEADLDGPLVIVTGSEGDGLSLLTRRSCDQLVRIPLRGATPSLNASVATALLLYEIARRGWMSGLKGQAPAPRISRPQLPTTVAAADQGATVILSEPEPEPEPEQKHEHELEPAVEARTESVVEAVAVVEAEPLPDLTGAPLPDWSDPAADDVSESPFSSDISL